MLNQSRLTPLTVIVTPATLTTGIQSIPSSLSLIVPELNFDKSIFAEEGIGASIETYVASTPPVIQGVTSSALQGLILSIQPPAPNCSYTINFFGPALSCNPYNEIKNTEDYPTSLLSSPDVFQYVAWAGSFTDFNSSRDQFPIGDNGQQDSSPATLWINVNTTVLQCTLFNASYSTEFHFSSGKQSIDTK